jgi:hypothetical protein
MLSKTSWCTVVVSSERETIRARTDLDRREEATMSSDRENAEHDPGLGELTTLNNQTMWVVSPNPRKFGSANTGCGEIRSKILKELQVYAENN